MSDAFVTDRLLQQINPFHDAGIVDQHIEQLLIRSVQVWPPKLNQKPQARPRPWFLPSGALAGFVPDRVTTDGHISYPRAIRSTLGRNVRHRTSVYLNNRLEQDHRGIKGRIRCMRGFKEHEAADRFCREYDELRNFLRSRSRHDQYVPATRRRRHFLQRARIAMGIMQIA